MFSSAPAEQRRREQAPALRCRTELQQTDKQLFDGGASQNFGAAGRMYPAPTVSIEGATGFGAPSGRALRSLSKCGKQFDKQLFDGGAAGRMYCILSLRGLPGVLTKDIVP